MFNVKMYIILRTTPQVVEWHQFYINRFGTKHHHIQYCHLLDFTNVYFQKERFYFRLPTVSCFVKGLYKLHTDIYFNKLMMATDNGSNYKVEWNLM